MSRTWSVKKTVHFDVANALQNFDKELRTEAINYGVERAKFYVAKDKRKLMASIRRLGPSSFGVVGGELASKADGRDYSGYQEYNQLFPPFEHAVSIVDLIFNEGENAKNYIKSFKPITMFF